MPKYKMLALDLDGTVLTEDKIISEETKYWISKAEQAGVVVVFATGRGLHGVEKFRGELNLETPMVLANGGEIRSSFDNLLESKFINRKDIHMLRDVANEIGASHVSYNGNFSVESSEWNEGMFELNWITFSMVHDNIDVIKEIQSRFYGAPSLEVTSLAPVNVEFSFKGITKESGVLRVCNELDIGMEEVMAIGDNLNDLNLIRAVGLGIAMGNAADNLKEVADGVTSTNEEDGVAKAIKKYLLAQ